jgi:uroporphyrinogen-III synthase
VLYLAGRDRKGAIEAALTGTFALEVVETYAAEARLSWRAREAGALQSCVAALHYSRRSAALAGELAKVSGEAERFLELSHFCLSGDVAEPLKALGAARVAVAETPDEEGLFQLLSRDLCGFPFLGASRI